MNRPCPGGCGKPIAKFTANYGRTCGDIACIAIVLHRDGLIHQPTPAALRAWTLNELSKELATIGGRLR